MASKKKKISEMEKFLRIIENLSEKDREYIKKLCSNYLAFQKISLGDMERLTKALSMKYETEVVDSFFYFLYPELPLVKIEKKAKSDYRKAYQLIEEIKLLYGPKIYNAYIANLWPNGLKLIRGETMLEPDGEESIHHLTFIRNDGVSLDFYHPLDSTLWALNGLLDITNTSMKELSDVDFPINITTSDAKEIKKKMAKLNKYLEKLSR